MKYHESDYGPLDTHSSLAGFTAKEYTIRLFEAESLLERLGYSRGKDHRWRKRVTAAEVAEILRIQRVAS